MVCVIFGKDDANIAVMIKSNNKNAIMAVITGLCIDG